MTAGSPISSLLVGPVAPLGPDETLSGIDKRPRQGPVELCRTGFIGDAQADLRHHGGPEKAVHHYDRGHYAAWQAELGGPEVLKAAGAFGENLSTSGMDETMVAVGDVFRAGTAVVEVSQGRQPCWRLNVRFATSDMARRVQATGRTGWYYRVLAEGRVQAGDDLVLLDRASPDWTIDRLRRAFYVDPMGRAALSAIAVLPRLAPAWREHARRRLDTGMVEDWLARLDGPAPRSATPSASR